MKKSIIVLTAIAAMFLTSCEKYLNIKPRGYDVASKIEHFEGLLLGQELYMLDESFPYMCFDIYTDKDGYDNAYSTIGPRMTNAYKWEKNIYREDETCGEWNSFTTCLYYYNVVINNVMDAEDGTEEQKLAILSEARMLRAYCTFLMSQFFGDVPIITEAKTIGGDYSLHSYEDVKKFVLTEMEESIGHLPDEEEHYKRLFLTSGNALFGKVLFYYGMYSEAEKYLAASYKGVRNRPEVGLVNYYERKTDDGEVDFIIYDQENPENLFYIGSMNRIWPAIYCGMYNMFLFGIRNDVIKTFYYDMKDTRLATMASVTTGKSAYKTFKKSEQYSASLSKVKTDVGVNVPALYVMYAECLARNGKVSEAAEVLLELRSNRMDPGHENLPEDVVTQDQMIVFAFEESIREQIGFGTLWFDMRRVWNDPLFQYLKPLYVHTVGSETYTLTEDRLYLQIPPSVLLWHPEYEK